MASSPSPRSFAKTKVAEFLIDHLNLSDACGEDNAVWNEMALAQMNTPDTTRITVDNKCRQTGWSFNESCIAVARAVIVPRSVTLFVSYNLDEAQEKITYARRAVDALDPAVRPKCPGDSKTIIELDNGSRLMSLPCKEPRGKGKPRIVLDEMAFYGNEDIDIFRASSGALGRGGCIRVGSTPKPSGLFRDMADTSREDKAKELGVDFVVREWPWWLFPHLTVDMESARQNAAHMTTQQRVDRYGSATLKELYGLFMATGDLAGFQQEHECAWISETAALIPGSAVEAAREDYKLGRVPQENKGERGVISIGADFGRRQDQTAYVVMHYHSGRYRVLEVERLRGKTSNEQAEVLEALIKTYTPAHVFGDVTEGFGHAVLIDMVGQRFPFVEGVSFSERRKVEEMAGAAVAAFNNRLVSIPRSDRLLSEDIKSIRKTHTKGGNIKYESPRDSKGHADSFWGLALALYALPRPTSGSFSYESVKKRDIDWEHMDRKPQARRVRVGPSARRLPAKGNNWSW